MDAMQCILTRRSIRQYTGEPITRQQLDEILKAAMYAPSAMKRLPWHFIVIEDKARLEEVTKVRPYAAFAPQAGCAVLVCADRKCNDNLTHLIQDTSAAIENMLLAAHAMGLGTCWCGVYSDEARCENFRKLCNIESRDILPMSLVVIGHPAQTPAQPQRMDDTRIHREVW